MKNKIPKIDFRLPRWGELPNVELYLEQMLSLIEQWTGEYLGHEGRKVMTKTMVNNYVKQRIIKAPVNKKYEKISLASLFVIAVLKPIYSISEISRLIEVALDKREPEDSYNKFCDMTEEAVKFAFSGDAMVKEYGSDDPRYIFWNVCNSFACQLYVRKTYLDI